MASPDLESMSIEELKQLRKEVDRAIDGYEARRLEEARAEIQEVAKKHGMSLSQLLSGSGKAGRQPAAPKFRNPNNPAQQWSGRGRRPAWFIEALEGGMTEADLSV